MARAPCDRRRSCPGKRYPPMGALRHQAGRCSPTEREFLRRLPVIWPRCRDGLDERPHGVERPAEV